MKLNCQAPLITVTAALIGCLAMILVSGCKQTSSPHLPTNQTKAQKADTLFVYIENSVSMDGYVTSPDFKTTIQQFIGKVQSEVLKNDSNYRLNYICQSVIEKPGETPKDFCKTMSQATFAAATKAKGDRSNSDIIDIIERVIKLTPSGSLSMLVSDCEYSPEPSSELPKVLKILGTEMNRILKSKSAVDSTFGAVVFRLMGEYRGVLYNIENKPIPDFNGDRPYYIWFFGNREILATVMANMTKIATEASPKDEHGKRELQWIAAFPGYGELPLGKKSSHFKNKSYNSRGNLSFSAIADLSSLPLPESYLANPENYVCTPENFKVTAATYDAKAQNYKLSITAKGTARKELASTTLTIALRSPLAKLPIWVEKYDNPDGTEEGLTKKSQTFGLKSLVDGLTDFYKTEPVATFVIKIN